ncbi:MAG TPA: hypothetical protein DCR98_14400, partial [Cobetia sp.]|nr:hypothetical protein [Cobetia sp.]
MIEANQREAVAQPASHPIVALSQGDDKGGFTPLPFTLSRGQVLAAILEHVFVQQGLQQLADDPPLDARPMTPVVGTGKGNGSGNSTGSNTGGNSRCGDVSGGVS